MGLLLLAGGCGGSAGTAPVLPMRSALHYRITDEHGDPELDRELDAALEDVWQWLAGRVPPPADAEPISITLLADRDALVAWAEAHDADAVRYIDRGGLSTTDGGAVLYFVGDHDTLRLARHEAVHQYLRQQARRLPPFVEEGFATLAEDGSDAARLSALRELEDLTPLAELLPTNAGQLRQATMRERSAWYAQAWAFADYVDRRHPGFWRSYFGDDAGFATLLTEIAGTDWQGVEADYARFVQEELER